MPSRDQLAQRGSRLMLDPPEPPHEVAQVLALGGAQPQHPDGRKQLSAALAAVSPAASASGAMTTTLRPIHSARSSGTMLAPGRPSTATSPSPPSSSHAVNRLLTVY